MFNRLNNARLFEEDTDETEEEDNQEEEKGEEEDKKPNTMPPPGITIRNNGFLFLSGVFNSDNVDPIVASIYEYNLMDEGLAPERITIVINSPGGRVDYCKMLLDAMWMSAIPVDTLASGIAMSCGVITLMAGSHRMATHNSEIMSHQYAGGYGGKEHEIYGAMKSYEMMSRWIEDHYKVCTGLSRKKIRKQLLAPTDYFMTAKEAKKFNIIDEVLHPKRVVSERKL